VTSAHQLDSPAAPSQSWASGLGALFRRVVLFDIDAGRARVAALSGVHPRVIGRALSLAQPSPLRWCLEAASPLVSSGRAPSSLAQ
jgi:hypothetical protein